MKRKKLVASLIVAMFVSTSVLAGCAKKAAVVEEKVPQVVNYYTSTEPETLDAQQMTGAPDFQIENMFMEGLVRYSKDEGKYDPGVATKWSLDEPTNTYTFELNKNAKWADGTAVTAKDFFFGWKLALDGQSAYGFMLTDYIVGAQDYADYTSESFYAAKNATFKALLDSRDAETDEAKLKTIASKISAALSAMPAADKTAFDAKKTDLWSKVGIKEVNGNIEIKLSKSVPYFIGLTANSVYHPVNETFYKAHPKDYTLEAAGLNSNGPWVVKTWKHNDTFTLEKNPNYWNKDNIKIDTLNLKVVLDVATRTNLLKTGALDGSAIQANDLKTFQDKAVLDQYKLQDLIDMPDYTVFYLEFNQFSNKITSNKNIRKAISLAMDRKGLVENVTQGDMAALSLIPDEFPGLSKSFREENGAALIEDNQQAKAKEALAAGLKELGLTKLPKQDVLIDQKDISQKQGEKMQADLKLVGIDINLVPVAWGDKLTRLKNGNFGICASGWGPDYMDPMTFLDLFQSKNGNNYGRYNNPVYDKLIGDAKNEKDATKRMAYLYDAEKLLMADSVVAPKYFRISHWTFKNYLTGVVNRGAGPVTDFYWASIDMKAKNADKAK
ncbi:peptide ABC transporter substrate-binding protein [Clostridium lacusfryxellense]|uniref:peptide ABC transporter substrate-binding protein n=1 Tax=Clostridium lacusfryxellense TaxID=205328 RepID=UPI001C0B1B8A|nr:peptide ABC transporter substrate-binding protein [Clostridium lacusfryxellense]MBU3111899.1 peptide ABC transporter substrate-binding protein [Clostridium lacusfryxellense]